MKKLCFVTASRSEYGLLRWIMQDVKDSAAFTLQLVVTGGHLLKSQGHTIDYIIEDGFTIDEVIAISERQKSDESIGFECAELLKGCTSAFKKLKPDMLVVLGDRYELLPITNAAFLMNIPIIHISGGDVTKGAIDDAVRNAVTMLATYHFPGTKDSADNIKRMRASSQNIYNVGEPGLDYFVRDKLMSRAEVAESLGIDTERKWILMTYHAQTDHDISIDLEIVRNTLDILHELSGFVIVATYANLDLGGDRINELLSKDKNITLVPSLGSRRYLSFMKEAAFVIGNSSSGIVEAPYLKIPVVNIGNRQQGRHMCDNIINTDGNMQNLKEAVHKALKLDTSRVDGTYYGDGNTAKRIVSILTEILEK